MKNGVSRVSYETAIGICQAQEQKTSAGIDRRAGNRQSSSQIKYARRASYLRRKREVRIQVFILAFGLALGILFITFLMVGMKTQASPETEKTEYKYYTSVTVAWGDSFDSIVSRYYDRNHYRNRAAYEQELCEMNRFLSYPYEKPELHPGENIIVSYYSDKFRP